jgi:hypothetical protein
MTISYTVNGTLIKNHINSNIHFAVGDTVPIYYNPKDSLDISSSVTNYKILGGVLLGFGILIISGVVLQYYIVNRFKFAAAATGVGDGLSGIARLF